ncbi:hypothetical protein [Streptomyces spinosisporus]|uniref:Uncharacterized protein n=1 Tax=Streptomyces spinosisporus TaxID=2927582 RepID=A0ABS9XE03_9ACTN|nr:hypothetical protein [Streptomyces spinosisporus]MCI3240281.1 hypothetical protein [Streptomyces spinosisporus]
MPAEITLPVHVRVGDHIEARFGDITVQLADGGVPLSGVRTQLAAFLREAADVLENPSEDDDEQEEVPDAPADR